MRPRSQCPPLALQAYVCALLLFSGEASGEDPDCEDLIQVQRNTVYTVSLGETLTIPCSVEFCQHSEKTVTWYNLEDNTTTRITNSSHISTELILSSPLEGTSYLMLNNIQRNDSGFYQCVSRGSQSFKIQVSVIGDDKVLNTPNTTKPDTNGEHIHLYIYTSAGIVVFVVLVIVVSVVWMRGCRGKPKTEPQRDLEYAVVSVRRRPSPRGSPSAAASPGDTPEGKPTPLRRDGETTAGGERRPKTAAEKGSVVYAALNQQPLEAAASSRPRRPNEQNSEYAAIRVS